MNAQDAFDLAITRASGACDKRAAELEASGTEEDARKAVVARELAITIRSIKMPQTEAERTGRPQRYDAGPSPTDVGHVPYHPIR